MRNRAQIKVWLCALICAVLGMSADAVEVTSAQAQTAVKNWVRKNPRAMDSRFKANSGAVETMRNALGRALCHVVNLDGGGFVVTSGDTKLSPIIAFSDSGTFSRDPHSPLFAMLQRDMTGRLAAIGESQESNAPVRKLMSASASTNDSSAEKSKTMNEKAWEDLLIEPKPVLKAVASSSQLDDVRVEPLTKTVWDQGNWGDYSDLGHAYNYWTPNHVVCGCVATAGAQIMKYWEYPKSNVTPLTIECSFNYEPRMLTMIGGLYDWKSMTECFTDDNWNLPEKNREAIGHLTYDVGVASSMGYTDTEVGSGTQTDYMVEALKSVFGYASAMVKQCDVDCGTPLTDEIRSAIFGSLDAGMPVSASIRGNGGHSVVFDGYGCLNGTYYTHINCGWASKQGMSDSIWYDVIGEKLTSFGFTLLNLIGYNIHPTTEGDVISGRVLDSFGMPVGSASVSLVLNGTPLGVAVTNDRGIYYFRVRGTGTLLVRAEKGGLSSKQSRVEHLKASEDAVYDDRKANRTINAGYVGNIWGVDLTLEDASDVDPEPLESVAAPVFSPVESSFTASSLSVSISCGTSGATIRYTKDGSEPMVSSAVYSSAIKITGTTTFKAKAFKNGMADSPVTTKTYAKVVVKPTITPQEAIGWSGKVTVSDGELVCGQDAESHDGKNALKISCTTEKTSATASISVEGPGMLSFWWAGAEQVVTTSGGKTSELIYMSCALNGKTVASRGRSEYRYMDWRNVDIPVPAGTHVVEWKTYATFPKGNRTGYVDEVSFTPYAGGVRTIRFNANGADEGELEKKEITGAYTDQITMPGQGTLVREGYAFAGWIRNPDSAIVDCRSGSTYTIGMKDETFYACWHRIVDVLVEFPQEGGEQEVRIDGYGNSFETDTLFPDWAGKFKLIGRGNFTATITLGNGRKNLSIGTDELYLNFTAEPNDTESNRSFDLAMIAHDYPLVIRYHIVQKGDEVSDLLKGVLVQCADSVVSGQSIKLSGSAVRRNGRVDAISPKWEIVSGAGNGSLSGGEWLTAGKVASAKTITVRATYKEGGIERTADKVVTVLPSCDLNAALDNADCKFTSNGWVGQIGDSLVGGSSARCGSCYEGTSVLKTTVTGPCKVSFDCRVTCGNGGGRLVFVDNGKTNFCACAVPMTSGAWTHRSFQLSEECDHRLEWVYLGNPGELSPSAPDDSAWLDGLIIEELTIPTAYTIAYELNGGTEGASYPTSAKYDTAFQVSAPTRNGYTFAGWTVTSGLNTSTAKWGTTSSPSTTISSPTTKCVNGATGSVWFKNLTTAQNGVVTLTANWTAVPSLDFEIEDGVLTGYKGAGGAVTIPAGVTAIGEGAFAFCVGLTSVTIPSSVTSIGDCAFGFCSGLTSVTILSGVTSIGEGAFIGCSGLTSVTIPSSVTIIGVEAFADCGGLTAISVEAKNSAFCSVDGILYNKSKTELLQCPGGKSGAMTIPSSVTSIEDGAFEGCRNLTFVSIPSSVTSIGANAFNYCSGLISIVVSSDNPALSSEQGILYDKRKTVLICCPGGKTGSVTIPSGVTSIGEDAFLGCLGLVSVSIPSSVTSIGEGAFFNCSGLTLVTIASGVTDIGDAAFFGCSGLTSVTIPSSVTSIGELAFYGCDALSEMRVNCGDVDRVKGLLSASGLDVSKVRFVEMGANPDVETGTWISDYSSAKTFADENDLPMVIFWTNPGCSFCDEMIAAFEEQKFLVWQRSRDYVFVYSAGDSKVRGLVKNDSGEFPYVAVQWPSHGIDVRFTGRDGVMPVKNGDLIDQFTQSVDASLLLTPVAPTYGPWGEAETVKNPDKLGPTMLTDMTLELNGAAGAVGDVVAAFRGDTGALCGLGKVMDESGTLSMVCYAPTGVKLHFKVWIAASGIENPVVLDCDARSDLAAPTSGAFLSGHALVVSDNKDLTISLGSADWHTVSFNVLPEDPSPAAVFGSVKTKIVAVTQGIEFWMPGKSSSLKAIEIGKGYWVNTKVDDVAWTISGKTDPKRKIALEEGWNLVGYAPEAEGAVQAVLKTALAAKAVDYVTYGVEFYPGGTLKKMEPGKAYWVHAKKSYTLVYDDAGATYGGEGARRPTLMASASVLGAAVPTYGPWGESEAVKNPDKLGPTFLTDMEVEIDGEPAEYGDVVAVFRGDTGALCGLGKVMDDSGTLTVVCYAPKGVTLSFKVWLSESGVEEAVVVKCDSASKLSAPESGAFYDGHAISGSTAELIETIVPGEKVTIDTGLIGYTASGLPTGLAYSKTTGKITGAATKPTAAEGVVVKFTKSGAETEELTIVVTAIPKVTVTMEGVNSPSDTDGCKVTGAGAYLVGKTVTLKATAPKGVAFVGWAAAGDGGSTGGFVAGGTTYSFTMGRENVALVAKFKKEVMTVECEALTSRESIPAGVLGAEGGIALDVATESGVKSVKVEKLPAGMKYDAKTGLITGAPTKAGDNKVVVTVTAKSGAVAKRTIEVKVAAMPTMAAGTFDGFVRVGEANFGTLSLVATDAGRLTAKVVTASGKYSFSKTGWDSVADGVYCATLKTKKGDILALTLDSTRGWDANQLSGGFVTAEIAATKKAAAVPSRTYAVSAQRRAFGKNWHFAATGDAANGWTLAYVDNAKAAALTVTLKADGSTAAAGKLPNGTDAKGKAVAIKVSASGYANVGGMTAGAIIADFAPIVTVGKVRRALSIRTNLWFDRSDGHVPGAGEARIVVE